MLNGGLEMTTAAIARCSECKAVVNNQWSSCPSCQVQLQPVSPYPTNQTWLRLWREVEAIANGFTKDSSQFDEIMKALDRCDALFLAGDARRFNQEIDRVNALIKEMQ